MTYRRTILKRLRGGDKAKKNAFESLEEGDIETTSPRSGRSVSSWASARKRFSSQFFGEEGEFRLRKIDKGARRVILNVPLPRRYLDPSGKPIPRYPSNQIRSSKYTLWNFIPKNIFEQFRRAANLYFWFLAALSLIPYFGVGSPFFAVFPICFVFFVTACKDGFEDFRRHQVDAIYNSSICHTLENLNVNYASNSAKPSVWSEINSGLFRCDRWSTSHLPKTAQHYHAADDTALSAMELPSSSINPNLESAFVKTEWRNVRVGDLILLHNNDQVPADAIILSTSDKEGACFIETKDLDGETNLKSRQALAKTQYIEDVMDCIRLHLYVESEAPNPNLYAYTGTIVHLELLPIERDKPSAPDLAMVVRNHADLEIGIQNSAPGDPPRPRTISNQTVNHWREQERSPVGIDNMLLRGHAIRNTDWIVAFVVYTGTDTKILLNAGKTPSKRSLMEKEMNEVVIVMFVILVVICIICAIASSFFDRMTERHTGARLYDPGESNPSLTGFLIFWASLIGFQNLIPISIYISIEFVKTLQAYFIWMDLGMWHEETQTTCTPKSWNVSDDLGQIEYIFSDKTGTLTRNIMEFRKCSIGGRVYGDNGFWPEFEGARGGRLRDMEATSAPLSDAEKAAQEKAENEQALRQREAVFCEYKSALTSCFTPKYSSLDPKQLTFADAAVFRDMEMSAHGEGLHGSHDDDIQSYGQGHQVRDFFTLLAICHTVVVETYDYDGDGTTAHTEHDAKDDTARPHSTNTDSNEPPMQSNADLDCKTTHRTTTKPVSTGPVPHIESNPRNSRKHKRRLRAWSQGAQKLHEKLLRRKTPRGENLMPKNEGPPKWYDPAVPTCLHYKAESPDEAANCRCRARRWLRFRNQKWSSICRQYPGNFLRVRDIASLGIQLHTKTHEQYCSETGSVERHCVVL